MSPEYTHSDFFTQEKEKTAMLYFRKSTGNYILKVRLPIVSVYFEIQTNTTIISSREQHNTYGGRSDDYTSFIKGVTVEEHNAFVEALKEYVYAEEVVEKL